MLALRRAARLCKTGNYSLVLRLIAAKLRPPGRPKPFDPERSVAEPWSVDQVEITDRALVVRGWSLPKPDGVEIEQHDFKFNGRPFDEVHYPFRVQTSGRSSPTGKTPNCRDSSVERSGSKVCIPAACSK